MAYTKEKKKALGAFYTPQILADLLARILLPLCKETKGTALTVLDPATGDSILLRSFAENAKNRGINYRLLGLDIDRVAINKSKKAFENGQDKCVFINTNALYPLGCSSPIKGWALLRKKHIANGIDVIISNPPWGADIDQTANLSKDFTTAVGQFDIYDIFIETIISNLKQDGIYGIIVPDSIFCKEHQKIRKLLLTETTIKGIIRLGEGFFSDVNFSVSIIYGIKKSSSRSNVLCSHLSNSDRKEVMTGVSDIYSIIKQKSIKVPVKQMVAEDYSFSIDVNKDDLPILLKFREYDIVKSYTTCQRGVELSKKGVIVQCTQCKLWFPEPRVKNGGFVCPHCKSNVSFPKTTNIISNIKRAGYSPLIVGQDISRYYVFKGRYIKNGYQGINYKPIRLYQGTKTVVRKTGVGITVGIDYNNSLTNQVVYVIKPRASANPLITAEVITAILSSRLITYVIIKGKGSIGWTSNPYLSQDDINNLPFPKFDFEDSKTNTSLKRITELVKDHSQTGIEIPTSVDAEIEKNIAYLYNIGKAEYDIIFKTIREVEQMIPFNRLLRIGIEDIFKDGI